MKFYYLQYKYTFIDYSEETENLHVKYFNIFVDLYHFNTEYLICVTYLKRGYASTRIFT